ncbi:MAG: hypothetical protein M2R45_05091 [Verrucomicrobia subdivision 3 bacterium]|nr:hypothetical protein [Limisphaerales bacterium]MCS1417168.1 hypothetical protein [Limisphaerales bacterium]
MISLSQQIKLFRTDHAISELQKVGDEVLPASDHFHTHSRLHQNKLLHTP